MTPERLTLLWGVTVFSGAVAQTLALLTGLPGWCCCSPPAC